VLASPALNLSPPSLVAKDWFAQATLLDQPLLAAGSSLTTGPINAVADLEPETLEGSAITGTTGAIPLSTAGKCLFALPSGGGKPKTCRVPVPGLPFNITGDLSLDGDFRGTVTKLVASAGLTIDVAGGIATLDPDGSYFQIDAGAGVDLSVSA